MHRFLSVIVFFPAMILTPDLWAEDPIVHNIPRFQMLADGLYRGGQPEVEGFEYLKGQGFKTVVNLRTENDEEAIVKRLGMKYVHIPISVKPWSKIPDKAIARYFQVVNNPDNYPVFFHCKRGADRTGAMAGFFRIAQQGWDGKRAYSEARDIGMRWWYPALKEQLYAFSPNREVYGKANAAIIPARIK